MLSNQSTPFRSRPLEIKGIDRPLLTPGRYRAEFITWRTFNYYDKSKIELLFELIDRPFDGDKVGMFLEVEKLTTKPGEKGEFIHKGKRSNFTKLLIEIKKIIGRDVSMDDFCSVTWELEVVTVQIGVDRKELAGSDLYSKADKAIPIDLRKNQSLTVDHDF